MRSSLLSIVARVRAAGRTHRDALVVLAVSMLLAGFASATCIAQQRHLGAARFDGLVRERAAAVGGELAAIAQLGSGAVAFLEADDRIDRQMWRTYVGKLHLQDRFPGALGVGYAPRIEKDDLAAMVQAVRGEGYADFQVGPAGERPVCFPTLFIEPFKGRNLRAFGRDMYAEPARREAMDAAVDSGEARATGKTHLAELDEQDPGHGIILFLPVYATARVPLDLELRRHALRGFVYVPVDVTGLMRTAVDGAVGPVDVALYAGQDEQAGEQAGALMYASAPVHTKRAARFRRSLRLDVFGTPWTMVVTSNVLFDASEHSRLAWLLLATGVAAGLLLSWLVHAGQRHAREVDPSRQGPPTRPFVSS